MSGGLDTAIARHRLDAFDANAADLVRRAGGKAVRVASKPLPWAPPQLRLTTLVGAEHTPAVHLLADARIVASVPTYRGTGNTW